MNIALIGRSEVLYNTGLLLKERGYNLPIVIKAAPEYTKNADDFESLIRNGIQPSLMQHASQKFAKLSAIELDIAVI